MNKRTKMELNAIMLTALAMGGNSFIASGHDDEIDMVLPIGEKPPSGTKEYFFNSSGEFSNQSMRKDETVFKCFAINDKNAKRKFNLWKSQNL